MLQEVLRPKVLWWWSGVFRSLAVCASESPGGVEEDMEVGVKIESRGPRALVQESRGVGRS